MQHSVEVSRLGNSMPLYVHAKGLPRVHAVQVIASFKNLTGRDPEMVVFASNFWDIASWGTRNASILDTDDLEDWVMEDFNRNMSHVLSSIEVSQPAWQRLSGIASSIPSMLVAWHRTVIFTLTCSRSVRKSAKKALFPSGI